MFDEYILIAPGSDYVSVCFNDLKTVPGCKYINYVISESCSPLSKMIHHIHFSFSLNRYFDLPLQCLWRKKYALQKEILDEKKKYCIIFTDISACRVDTGYLRKLHSIQNVTMVLSHGNLVCTKERMLKNRYKYFSAIFSFDKGDCAKYGFYPYTTYYSKINLDTSGIKESDMFFVGVSKDKRHEKLVHLFHNMKDKNLTPDFYIANHKELSNREEGIHYNEWLNYKDVLGKVLKTRCLLEIVGEKQDGLTLRSIEAICYNKRLITDNPAVKRLKYYDKRYIQYVQNIEDADLSFICSDLPVDYHYQNDYSPLKLLDNIDEVFSQKII
jgi:hypothetical protein